MTTLDFVTAAIIAGFVFGGYASGLIQSAGSVAGLIIGTTLAGRWYHQVGGWIKPFVGGQLNIAEIVGYGLIVLIIARVFGLALALFLKVFKIFTIVPGLKSIDKLGGVLFGFAEGALIIGLTFSVALNVLGTSFQKTLDDSKFAKSIQRIGAVLLPLVPKALKEVQDAVPNVNLPNPGATVNAATSFQDGFNQLQNANNSLER